MKIEPTKMKNNSQLNSIAKNTNSSETQPAFLQILEKKRSENWQNYIETKLREIDEAGKKLSDSPTVDNVVKYKQLIKELLEDTVNNGLTLMQKKSSQGGRKTNLLTTIQEIERKLLDLTDETLSRNAEPLQIIDLIGQIRGLLIDLYL